jgi:hypothetical protein
MLLLPKRNKYSSRIIVTYKIIAQVIVSRLEGLEMIFYKSSLFLLQPLSNKKLLINFLQGYKLPKNSGTLKSLNTAAISMLPKKKV